MKAERVHRFRSSGRAAQISAVVAGNRVTLHCDADALDAMYRAIDGARVEILLEMYWFGSDRTGWRFADALCRAAERGVTVQVVYDAIGSLNTDDAMFDAMRRAGCEVFEYHPVAPWRERFRWGLVGHRNHRKLLIVDQRVAMLGGVNLADPWARVEDGGKGWIDDMVAIVGPAALHGRTLFARSWGRVLRDLGEARGDVASTPPLDAGVATAQPVEAAIDHAVDDERGIELGSAGVRLVANHFRDERHLIRRAYLAEIGLAQREIFIANSYFIPDSKTRKALIHAANRGVAVHVLVPGVSDVPLVKWASRASYDPLLREGVRIYEWQGPVLHAKTATVDGRWLTIGTFNLDARSLRYNLEINAMITDNHLAQAAQARIEAILARTAPVELGAWRRRPRYHRVLEVCARALAPWL